MGESPYKDLLEEVRKMVFKKRNKLVNRIKLHTMVQGGDEPITSFETRLKPVARTGRFQEPCLKSNFPFNSPDQVVLDNLIRGMKRSKGRSWPCLRSSAPWRRC